MNPQEPMDEEENQITIQDLQLSLEIYEIESEKKLEQLRNLFSEKGSLDLAKMFYEERSSIQIKFQNIIGDLIEFLVKQEVPSTEKLRKMFYRILENPLLLLFKVSRFEIFELRLNGFDIQITPIQAIEQLAKSLYLNIDCYLETCKKGLEQNEGQEYKSWDSFIGESTLNLIRDKIFVMYSYLRKGATLLKKKVQSKAKIVEILNDVQEKLLPILIEKKDTRTLKELSILNYEIYELENTFQVLNFYLAIPLKAKFAPVFEDFQRLALKAKQGSTYNVFILLFVKFSKQIMEKIKFQGIDSCFSSYIENALIAILEMWGCRICHFGQFCDLFTLLFSLHPNEVQILELCLKHTPNMQKDDIVLLRTNFKLQLANKHGQLLSLMKDKKLQEINEFLSTFYHRVLYNLNFKQMEREKIINFLTLINGNSSLVQLFQITEKAFKEWNHTIDFNHSHKFLASEFALPKISNQQIKESFALITNLCSLEDKGFNIYYQPLIKAGTISKALLSFSEFLIADKNQDLLKNEYISEYMKESFNFLKKCINPATEGEKLVTIYADLSKMVAKTQEKSLSEELWTYIKDNFDHFKLIQCLEILKTLGIDSQQIIEEYMIGAKDFNSQIQLFSYFGKKCTEIQQLSEKQASFLEKHAFIKNNVLHPKDNGIFKLTQLQIMTNPIQFEKVMDNYYFNLEPNAKKFIERCCHLWRNSEVSNQFQTKLIRTLLEKYPISVPILASTRVEVQEKNMRFVEYLCENVPSLKRQKLSEIIMAIMNTSCIRYKNGKDYVQEQIVPIAVKCLAKSINETENQSQSVNSIIMLSKVLQRANLKQFKMDLILKTIEKIRFLLKKTQNPIWAEHLGFSHERMLKTFFMKKQIEMKRQGLAEGYKKMIWSDVRNYSSLQNDGEKALENCKIPDQIIVTPFTLSQDFNILEYKNKRLNLKKTQDKSDKMIQFSKVSEKIQKVEEKLPQFKAKTVDSLKKVDISTGKFNVFEYLGKENLQDLCKKENITLTDGKQTQIQNLEVDENEQNKTLLQFYLKEYDIPTINTITILKILVESLSKEEEHQLSSLWTNQKNLEHFYMNLLTIFEFAFLPVEKRSPQKNQEIDQIVELVNNNNVQAIKKIMKIFKQLGYSNIWAENLNIYWNNFPIRKQLGFNNQSSQSFLSILLKNTLENEEYREILAQFLGSFFETRQNQNALMYKVALDKQMMNIIMRSLSIPHLDKISLLFHSNFNNLRLYTDQLHEGMKALNMASKNRNYNEFVKLSESVEQEEFYGPMKLFKENFSFFIRIEKEGYIFKKNEQIKLTLDRIKNVVRMAGEKENVSGKVDEILQEHIAEIKQLQSAIANRVKSFYLVTKLRDLSYQNSLMINIMHSTMKNKGKPTEDILNEIDKVQLFSLMNKLNNELIRFEDDWRSMEKYSSKFNPDKNYIQNQVNLCTTRRFSHSMSKTFEKSDLQFDEVLQRCFDALKTFFTTQEGQIWMKKIQIFPAFLAKSFIDHQLAQNFCESILKKMRENSSPYQFNVSQNNMISDLLRGFRAAPRSCLAGKLISISYQGKTLNPVSMLPFLVAYLQKNETFVTLKESGFIIFNKFKSSEATLEEIQVLGKIIGYALLNNENINVPLHPSLVAALSFNTGHVDYLLDINFKVWEELKGVLSTADSSTLKLNFSYVFESVETLKGERVQLIDKGSSKKVNNQNRQEFCDLVCCYILYEQIRPQVTRLIESIIEIVPKEYLCCRSIRSILVLFYEGQVFPNERDKIKRVLDDYMRKIGVVYPETIIYKGKRVENLKDFQNVQWFQEILLSSPKLQAKYWKDETNLLLFTMLSNKGLIEKQDNTFVIHHFSNKEEMRRALEMM